jgi:hypothetical protein
LPSSSSPSSFSLSSLSSSSYSYSYTGVVDFVRNATLAATHGFWQIIELQETDTPGEFIVWAMTSSIQLQKLTIMIPRVIYVNIFFSGIVIVR